MKSFLKSSGFTGLIMVVGLVIGSLGILLISNAVVFGQEKEDVPPNVQVMASMESYHDLVKPFLGKIALFKAYQEYGFVDTYYFDGDYTKEEIMSGKVTPILHERATIVEQIPLYVWIMSEKSEETLVWQNPWIDFMHYLSEEARQIVDAKKNQRNT